MQSALKYLDNLQANNNSDIKPVFVMGVGFWDKAPYVPNFYFNSLSSQIRKRTQKVFLMGIPTAYVTKESELLAYPQRNGFTKSWIQDQNAQAGGPPHYHYVDVDALLKPAGEKKLPGPGGDKHLMCWFNFPSKGVDKMVVDNSTLGTGPEGAPVAQILYGVPRWIQTGREPHCADEYNRNIWQMIFNVLVSNIVGTRK